MLKIPIFKAPCTCGHDNEVIPSFFEVLKGYIVRKCEKCNKDLIIERNGVI